MGAQYTQLDLAERCAVARLQAEGRSIRQIAAALDRSPSTIARELKRNTARDGYRPDYAQQQAQARRWRGSRLERDDQLRARVLRELARGLSPQQVAGRLAREAGAPVISHESIYRFIYAQASRAKPGRGGGWRQYLPRRKAKRGWRGRKGGSSVERIQLRRPLSERPAAAAGRLEAGHWEADLMLFGRGGPLLLMLHERSSRLLVGLPVAGKAAAPVARLLLSLLRAWPPALRRTVAFDNGTEFARHYELHRLGVETFFCDPYAPWQKGGIENAIGRLRRVLPRRLDLAQLSLARLIEVLQLYNNTPRQCLDYLSPAEVFGRQLLQLQCEPTFPPSRE